MPAFSNLFEQPRINLLDILKQNLEIARRETYINRMILIGEHDFGMSSECGVGESIRNVATEVNETYTEERLTGLLLCYPIYFCIVIEGSENTLVNFIMMLIKKYGNQIRKFKMLAHFHNIHARLVDDWVVAYGKPVELLEKIPTDADVEGTFKYVRFCVKKLFGLCSQTKQQSTQEQESIDRCALSLENSSTTPSSTSTTVSPSYGTLERSNKRREFLPEYGLLEFLLDSQHLTDVFELVKKMNTVPNLDAMEDLCWPSGDPVLLDGFFSKPSDPIPDIPHR